MEVSFRILSRQTGPRRHDCAPFERAGKEKVQVRRHKQTHQHGLNQQQVTNHSGTEILNIVELVVNGICYLLVIYRGSSLPVTAGGDVLALKTPAFRTD